MTSTVECQVKGALKISSEFSYSDTIADLGGRLFSGVIGPQQSTIILQRFEEKGNWAVNIENPWEKFECEGDEIG